jgi:hypothetical protein
MVAGTPIRPRRGDFFGGGALGRSSHEKSREDRRIGVPGTSIGVVLRDFLEPPAIPASRADAGSSPLSRRPTRANRQINGVEQWF